MTATSADTQILSTDEEAKAEEKPWKVQCSFGCYHARSEKKKCRCRCKGKLHGQAHEKHLEELKLDDVEFQSGEQ